jgi:hypothetical protein
MSHYDSQGRRVLSGNPSTWEAEAKALLDRVAKLEVALSDIAEGRFSMVPAPDYVTRPVRSPQQIARAALQEGKT